MKTLRCGSTLHCRRSRCRAWLGCESDCVGAAGVHSNLRPLPTQVLTQLGPVHPLDAIASPQDQRKTGRRAEGGPRAATMRPTMYAKFFGLRHEPFSIAPDPRYLFMSERHREALAHLLYGVRGGGGFVLLTGEIGAGKTTVCRCFLEQVPRRCNVAYIFNPKLTVEELLRIDLRRVPHPARRRPRAPTVEAACRCAERVPAAHARGRAEQRAHHRRGAEPVAPTCWSSCGC